MNFISEAVSIMLNEVKILENFQELEKNGLENVSAKDTSAVESVSNILFLQMKANYNMHKTSGMVSQAWKKTLDRLRPNIEKLQKLNPDLYWEGYQQAAERFNSMALV